MNIGNLIKTLDTNSVKADILSTMRIENGAMHCDLNLAEQVSLKYPVLKELLMSITDCGVNTKLDEPMFSPFRDASEISRTLAKLHIFNGKHDLQLVDYFKALLNDHVVPVYTPIVVYGNRIIGSYDNPYFVNMHTPEVTIHNFKQGYVGIMNNIVSRDTNLNISYQSRHQESVKGHPTLSYLPLSSDTVLSPFVMIIDILMIEDNSPEFGLLGTSGYNDSMELNDFIEKYSDVQSTVGTMFSEFLKYIQSVLIRI